MFLKYNITILMTMIIVSAVVNHLQTIQSSILGILAFRNFRGSKTKIMAATVKDAIKHWWISLILGIVFILTGIWVILTPLTSYIALSLLFSIMFFVNGILEIIFAISNRHKLDGWGWQLTGGLVDLLLGLILLAIPGISMIVLSVFVGFGLMFRSMIITGFSFDLKHYHVPGWGWLLALSVIAMLFSFMLIFNPVFAGLTIVYFTAMALFVVGFFRIILAIKLKTIHNITRI